MLSIYSINKNYNIQFKDGKPDETKLKNRIKNGNIDEINYILESSDKGYHEILNDNIKHKLFIDVDKVYIDDGDTTYIINELLLELSLFFKVDIKAISYTESIKENTLSYHVSIPSICGYLNEIKYYMKIFISQNPLFKEYIDDIYNNNRWFRLPNQTNELKTLKHKIIVGKMSDFILNYTACCNVELPKIKEEQINNFKIISKTNNNNDTIINNDIILKLLNLLTITRLSTYSTWLNVIILIKCLYCNDQEQGLLIAHTISKKVQNYDEKSLNSKWGSFQKNQYTINTLYYYAKQDDPENLKL